MKDYVIFYSTKRYHIMLEIISDTLTIVVYDKSGEGWEEVAKGVYNLLTYTYRSAFKHLRKTFNI